mmetsp:Transcript_6040/g.9167  ORF Transcript_6040/g.9167 Transcript_6040/m.9167 type:complete len:129 (-) Transcript_6040:764-1150(-)
MTCLFCEFLNMQKDPQAKRTNKNRSCMQQSCTVIIISENIKYVAYLRKLCCHQTKRTKPEFSEKSSSTLCQPYHPRDHPCSESQSSSAYLISPIIATAQEFKQWTCDDMTTQSLSPYPYPLDMCLSVV